MSRRRYVSYLSLLYVLALLGLLGLLAVLQYRWTGEASVAEAERLRQGLQNSLLFVQREFDAEMMKIAEAYWQPPVSADRLKEDWLADLERTLEGANHQWLASASDPRLLGRVLVASDEGRGAPDLYYFDAGENRLRNREWPQALLGFRESLKDQSSGPRPDPPPGRRLPRDPEGFPFYSIRDELPAIISVLVFIPPPEGEIRRGELLERSRRQSGKCKTCLIIWLDRTYLFEEWIPALARRYLPSAGADGYDYVLRSREKPHPVFCTSRDADVAGIIAKPDGLINLIEFRNEQPRRRQPAPGAGGGPAVQLREPTTDGATPAEERRRRPGLTPGAESVRRIPDGAERALAERAIERRQQLAAATEMLAYEGWQLLVKHRAGSLDAVVRTARIRNLAISFGILLLLAVSLVLVTVSVSRARRLAKQQMEFVATVSHELRTPIAVICSTAENLADGLITRPSQVTQYGNFILREGRHLGTLVEQTLAYAGIESGKLTLKTQPLELAEVIKRVVDNVRPEAATKSIEIAQTTSEAPTKIAGDPASLDTAVRNLIGNAIKYSRPGTTVRVTLQSSPSEKTVQLIVSDEGIGIETAEIPRLFEPFFRGNNAVRAQIRGAGIGLSLVKRIVDSHGGTIEVQSRIGEGSTFTVAFPTLPESGTTREGAPVEGSSEGVR